MSMVEVAAVATGIAQIITACAYFRSVSRRKHASEAAPSP